ncbi:hypothetical protein TPHA_0G01340 [Tetrapisispora phaffii CBS 4417]|uniref:Nodulin-like domain-containing protein n=1 Tax=Tetrapisispora phaffii (strain ATCC 24235 / CBS 4417 / NBRC 1672 / NRRL Y-8282 / UCD 70-5) TaxID=1071381 RepID=G8BVP3_TETPH|nr:hypothetical protein TPHA_0G01340 [Tetrapisispora phaffii CBS 4417]CCE63971.1 hypothetical protein TPHA_0G01340 [Tetrapisispora phaffii CBS 4417]
MIKNKRSQVIELLQIICAVIWCLLSAGIIFGFAAFKQVLINEGVYSESCQTNETRYSEVQTIIPCTAQDLKLNTMFTVSAAITNVLALPVGWVLDIYGPKVSGIIGSSIIYFGAFNFIMAESLIGEYYDPYLIGFLMLAVGGPFVFISSFHLSNIFPARGGMIMALITGSFDSSSALFLIYKVIYEKSDNKLSLQRFFSYYLIVPTFIIVAQIFIMPKHSYQSLPKESYTSASNLNSCDTESTPLISNYTDAATSYSEQQSTRTPRRRSSSVTIMAEARQHLLNYDIFEEMHERNVKEQILSPWFYLMLFFAAICMLRINYFIATIRSQVEYLLGDETTSIELNNLFDFLLPIGGVVAVPIIGHILDNIELSNIIKILSGLSIIIGGLGIVPNSYACALIEIVLFVMYRPFYYTVVSDYTSKIFGFTTFGTVYGLLTLTCGVFNMLQRRLDIITHTTFKMNPLPVNIILLATTIITSSALIIFMTSRNKKIA